jgi:hypothetical protein
MFYVVIVLFLLTLLWSSAICLLINTLEPKKEKYISEIFGFSIMIGAILLGISNYFLSLLIGGYLTGFTLILAPLVLILLEYYKNPKLTIKKLLLLHPSIKYFSAFFFILLLIVNPVYSFFSAGYFYRDIIWHSVRVSQMSFSEPGFIPKSPVAFPDSLPFLSFIADSLVSSVIRYLPSEIWPFHYSLILFLWVLIFWFCIFLVISHFWRALLALVLGITLAPYLIVGPNAVVDSLWVHFHANPNSAVIYPIGFVLFAYLADCYLERKLPLLSAISLIPPATVFIKINNSPALLFIQSIGFTLWLYILLDTSKRLAPLNSIANLNFKKLKLNLNLQTIYPLFYFLSISIFLWLIFYISTKTLGQNPVDLRVWPYLSSLVYYLQNSFSGTTFDLFLWSPLAIFYRFLLFTIPLLFLIFLKLKNSNLSSPDFQINSLSKFKELIMISTLLLITSVSLLIIVWTIIAPTPNAGGGEPVQSNIVILSWTLTIIVWLLLVVLFEVSVHKSFHVILSCILCLIWINFLSSKKYPNIPQMNQEVSITAAQEIRSTAKTQIPGGNCYGFEKHYSLFIKNLPPNDFVSAATGCPLINGEKWRGYLGSNDPLSLSKKTYLNIEGKLWKVVKLTF